tara:strand:+ start:4653 stop:5372 length:720 start_codon:yes stop_codon:yes gene_type:complete
MGVTIISLTSIPSRFKYLPAIVYQLSKQGYDIWLNIPHSYNRFPNQEVVIPDIQLSNVKINRCKDYGPGTMYFGPIEGGCTADNVIVVNDDTSYPDNMAKTFISFMDANPACWCMSGFNIDEYCKNNGKVNRYDGADIDVTESYGGVILQLSWLQDVKHEFESLLELTYNDDILVSNLMAKMGINRKTICNHILNIGMIKQYSYGMEQDALWQNDGEGSHVPNNKRVFEILKKNEVYYF